MEQNSKGWEIERICSKCGHRDKISVSKRDAAFELVDIDDRLGKSCSQCSAASFSTILPRLELDWELFKEWALDEDLYFMQQDEDLLIADQISLEMILKALDTIQLSNYKQSILLSALCVIVYDHSVTSRSKPDIQLKDRVIQELNIRIDQLTLVDGWIMDYIKKVVFPQLAFSKK